MLTRIHQGASLSQVSIFTAQNACPLIGGGTTEKSRGLSFVGKELSSVVNQRGFRAAELQRSALVAGTTGVQRISASWFRTSCGLGWHNVHAMDFVQGEQGNSVSLTRSTKSDGGMQRRETYCGIMRCPVGQYFCYKTRKERANTEDTATNGCCSRT